MYSIIPCAAQPAISRGHAIHMRTETERFYAVIALRPIAAQKQSTVTSICSSRSILV